MTRDRRRKQDLRAASAATSSRYVRVRREAATPPGASIRTHKGNIHICIACGQPAYASTNGPSHFAEQDSGVYCPNFPAAVGLLRMDWDRSGSIGWVRQSYPWPSVSANPHCSGFHISGRFRDYTGTVSICSSCGQPAFQGEYGPTHFTDQWDGILCPYFPLAGDLVKPAWNADSLESWKAGYPCSYHRS
ncbi:hypothetical protein OG824_31680 [Streptomyces prunicolor]|uniref:hypothetical protein n=1 Tax=Streptomyces prunicolor TaxID=67348 RepID=UPI0022548B4E|nr:hypothetical protein [Streptomyces prunicolor]MCX5239771.1 hypothetical protein [Streptomyces prunicolor]